MTPSNTPGNVSKGNRQEPGSNKGDEKNDKKREGSPAQSTPNLEVICTDGKTDPKERNTLEEEGGVEAKQRQNPYTFAEVVAGIADQDTNLQFIPAIEANPPLEVVKGYVNRIWKSCPIDSVEVLKEGQFLVSFKKEDDMKDIIKRRYYYFDNKLVLVQQWKPGMKLNIEDLSDIPICVQFPDLEVKYWSLSGLSKLGSLIGKPIKRDKATARKTKYAFARIQIEVKVHQHFPKDIVFIDDEGRAITQKIDCICSNCKKLGHLQDNCRKKDTKKQEDKQKRVVWRPKGNKDVQIDDEGPGKTDQPQKEKGTESPPDEEGFTVVSEKKVSKRILMNIEEGDFMSKLQKLLEKASYEGHYPFLK